MCFRNQLKINLSNKTDSSQINTLLFLGICIFFQVHFFNNKCTHTQIYAYIYINSFIYYILYYLLFY